MTQAANTNISNLLNEQRKYPPSPMFTAQANAQPGFYDQDPDEFWEREGRDPAVVVHAVQQSSS